MHFRIRGLPAERFAPLFRLSDDALRAQGGRRVVADRAHAFPCRISLTDAEPGDEVLLLNYEHLDVDTPFRSRYAVYVREGETTHDAVDQVPDMLRRRLLSVRAFDGDGMLLGAEVVEGTALEPAIARQFATPGAAWLHLHFAAPGCYAARVDRVHAS